MRFRDRYYLILTLILLLIIPYNSYATIYINEILAVNHSTNYDSEYYNFSDWIELYNSANETVNLYGYTLTDDIAVPDKYKIDYNYYIYPNSFRILWADEKDRYAHTNFSLSSKGECVALFNPQGVLVDSICFSEQIPDISFGRYPDGSKNKIFIPVPSSGATNTKGVGDVTRICDSVTFSVNGGFYAEPQSLELFVSSPGAEIRYTLDGSWPGPESDRYSSAIEIQDNTVVRTRVFEEDYLPGPVCTQTYLIDQEISLPVVSISTKPDYLFSDTYGIYVEGSNGITGNCVDYPVNFNQPWERAISFEYFSHEGECKINQTLGMKIAGRCSRARKTKSLGLYSRNKYGGAEIGNYQFFRGKNLGNPKTLLLRNSGTESYSTYLRDGFMQTLIMGRMDIDYQAYQPVVVYINGDYWGIHNLREKMNEHYVNSNYNIDPDAIDLLEINTMYEDIQILEGDLDHYENLYNFISDNDMSSQTNYHYVKSQMDVDEYMNIHIANIYFENEDWPNNNNKFWRERKPGGKWRWYLFDLDFGFGYWPKSNNTVNSFFDGNYGFRLIAYKLKNNEEFRNEFIQRMASHLNTTFEKARVLHVLDSIKGNISEEMHRHIERWGSPYSHGKWEENLQVMIDFTNERTEIVTEQMMSEFSLSGTYNLYFLNAHPLLGDIEITGVEIPDEFTGFYFDNIPLRLQAIPKPGYQFSGWTGDINSKNEEIFITSERDISIFADFEIVDPIEGIYINEFIASNNNGVADEHNEYEDWIELYNSNDYPINLAGLFISDSSGNLTQYKIPYGDPNSTTVQANDYIVLWADGEPNQGCLHLSFKLNRVNESIFLAQKIGDDIHVIDSVHYSDQYSNVSYGRDPDEPDLWKYLKPTPNFANEEKIIENIYINEFMASNQSVLEDRPGEFDDWIEIYNANSFAVDIAGMFISDNSNNPRKLRIPDAFPDSTTVPALGYLILWADDSTKQGILHMNFRLSGSGEQIILTQPGGIDIIDTVTYPNLISDAPYGRVVDGSGDFNYMISTPGATNNQPSFSGIYINEFMPSNQTVLEDRTGEFDDWIELYNDNDYPIDAGGLFLSDDINLGIKYRISTAYPDSTTIPAKGHLLIWADDSVEQGLLHAPFKLSGNGESIILSSPTVEKIIDSISFGPIYNDAAYGRLSDGNSVFGYMKATPGDPNINVIIENVYINEILAANSFTNCDEFGEFDDWIELYNSNDFPVNIGGLFITDDFMEGIGYRLPTSYPELTTIEANSFLLIWADDSAEQGILHTNFKLKREGERIVLLQSDGFTVIDSILFSTQFMDVSYGRDMDGTDGIGYLVPTPEGTNRSVDLEGIIITEVMASDQTGFMDEHGEYDDWIELFNAGAQPVDIAMLRITDSLGYSDQYFIPAGKSDSTTMQPGEYMILWADNQPEQGVLHLDFKLREGGEQLGLYTPNGKILDTLSYPNQFNNFSFSKMENSKWIHLPPSPGEENTYPLIQNIYINEFMSDNENRIVDEFGEFDDWIEIYNSNDFEVNVAGLFISDSLSKPDMYRIPSKDLDNTEISANGYLVIWTDNDNYQGPLHTNFKLSKSGETLVLSGYDPHQRIDSKIYKEQYSNFASARLNDSGPWLDMPPTPGSSNILPDNSNIVINEIMAANMSIISDNYGEYDDWIELYNSGTEEVDVGGLFISDSIADPKPFRISSDYPDSTTIKPKQYLLIWADDSTEQGILHTSFKLSRSGEQVALFNYDKAIIDSTTYKKVPRDYSYGRLGDGNLLWNEMTTPTPLNSNIVSNRATQMSGMSYFSVELYPNPTSEYLTIQLDLHRISDIIIRIYDQTGSLVAIPVDGIYNAGSYEFLWNLTAVNGNKLNTGLYFFEVETNKNIQREKLIILN